MGGSPGMKRTEVKSRALQNSIHWVKATKSLKKRSNKSLLHCSTIYHLGTEENKTILIWSENLKKLTEAYHIGMHFNADAASCVKII